MSNPVEPRRPLPPALLSRRNAAIVTAVLWTAAMMWASPPDGVAGVVVLMIAGALFGVLWAWLFGIVMRRIGVPVW